MRRIVVLAAVAGLAGVATVASGFSAQRVSDPPLIVPWHQIGSVGIGESRTRVTYDYGRPQVADFYLLHGGRLEVAYANDRVTWLYLERTRFHETPKGVGIGFRVPLGACHLVKGVCVYRWNGFRYRPYKNGLGTWERIAPYNGDRITVRLSTYRGVINNITLISSHFRP
jgi:hypothetical protein